MQIIDRKWTWLDIQLLLWSKIRKFFKWHNERWEKYFEFKETDKLINTMIHLKEMEKHDRFMVLGAVPYLELREQMQWRELGSIMTGEEPY